MKMANTDKLAAQCPVYTDQKCELCETNDIMFQCIDCDEMMCETCKNSHLKSKASKNHQTVSVNSSEVYETKESQIICCGVHPNHSEVNVEEVKDTNQQELSKTIGEINKTSKRYKDDVKTVTQNKFQFSESIAKKIEEVKARNEQLKIRLDKIESEYIKQLENKDKENTQAMTELEQRLQKEICNLNQLIKQCECKQRDGILEMVQLVTDIKQKLEKCKPSDLPDAVCLPELLTRDVDNQELKDLFGHLDMKTKPEVNQPLQTKRSVPPAIDATDFKIISNFSSDQNFVVMTENDQAWLWRCGNTGISLVTSDGQAIQNINTEFMVFDAAVSTSGNLLVTEWNGNKVKKLKNCKRFTDIFTAAEIYQTRGITVKGRGNILVVLYKYDDSKIVEITTSGQHIRTIQHDPIDNNLLFVNPWFICTNTNGDIVVTDNGCKVVVVNRQGEKRFRYKGSQHKGKGREGKGNGRQPQGEVRQLQSNGRQFQCGARQVKENGRQPKGEVKQVQGNGRQVHGKGRQFQGEGRQLQKSILPFYVVTDKHGHITISDYQNSVVHVLDRDGKFIQYLITPEDACNKPSGLDLDNHGRLWVCNSGKKKIDIIKYL